MTAPPCKHNKAVYHVKDIAERMAKQQASRARHPIHTYWCAECRGWHLTKFDPEKYREYQELLKAARSEINECAPTPAPKPAPGHWTALQAAKTETHKLTERANNLKRAVRKADSRHGLWDLCLRPSVSEAKLIAKLQAAKIPRLIDRLRKVQQELAARTIEATRLRDLLRQIDSAWVDRGRYVKTDQIEGALREWRGMENQA